MPEDDRMDSAAQQAFAQRLFSASQISTMNRDISVWQICFSKLDAEQGTGEIVYSIWRHHLIWIAKLSVI